MVFNQKALYFLNSLNLSATIPATNHGGFIKPPVRGPLDPVWRTWPMIIPQKREFYKNLDVTST